LKEYQYNINQKSGTMQDRRNKFIDTVYECCDTGVRKGVFQIIVQDYEIQDKMLTIDGKKAVNYGSCSYLGLELDERIKQGAIEATRRYGTQYSSSRAYSACALYEEAEDLMSKIFDNNPAVLAATTTLTHVGVMPVLLQDSDLIILDQKVHGSIQMASQLLKARGARVEMIRHNQMDVLEDMIKQNLNKYDQIWYMADGIYSMFGDVAPMEDIIVLLNKYENFYFYVDDAHGMSWTGKFGRGFIMGDGPLHPKIFLTTSLAKGFGVGGGVFVTSDEAMKRKILTCGTSYTFSGPIQPPMLGAIVESAKIHLSAELPIMQQELKRKIDLAYQIGKQLDLPEVYPSSSPIFYYALGQPRVGYSMINKLLDDGFYTNIGIFPTVPVNCTGLRIPITLNLSDEDILNVLESFSYHFPKILTEENANIDQISRSFKHDFAGTKKRYFEEVRQPEKKPQLFNIQHETSINKLDKNLWNSLLGNNGSFDWDGCKFIEDSFSGNIEEENNWDMHYVIIRDLNEKPILATFFSVLIAKDDMVSPEAVSQYIEEKRKTDKTYLTSKVVSMGSLITEGNHLFLDRTNLYWKTAILELIKIMNEVKNKTGASALQLRDFDTNDEEIKDFLINEGFIRVDLPDSHMVVNPGWKDEEEFIEGLSKRSRQHVRRYMQRTQDAFDISFDKKQILENFDEYYGLYLNVKRSSFKINTFDLPIKMFKNAILSDNWEIMSMRIKGDNQLCSFILSYKSAFQNYSPIVIGLDYLKNEEYSCYRQGLFQIAKRATEKHFNNIYLGMDASIEKQKIGAIVSNKSIFLQLDDNYSLETISILSQN
jgi:7-keto-8-aminopelargonate synthetase-like enzyme